MALLISSILWYAVQVNMIKGDGSVIHFNNPKVQASLSANTFAVTGHAETKRMLNFRLQFVHCKICARFYAVLPEGRSVN